MRDLRRSLGLGALGVAAVAIPAACTDAGGSVSGGDLVFEGGAPVVTSTVDAGPGAGTGTTFTDLYRDFFGPSGAAKCAGNGACHGAADQPGAMASGGYICPDVMPTADAGASADGGKEGGAGNGANPAKAQCRDTMMKVIIVDPPFSGTSTCGKPFAKAYMHNVIRKATHAPDDENNMPKSPVYTFSDESVARIDAWVQAGCPDN
jgi:hypothetical protein